MIIKAILEALKAVIFAVFSFLNLPKASEYGIDVNDVVTTVNDILNMTISVINLLFPWTIVTRILPLVIIVANLDKVYKFIMWIVRKIPMLGVQ